MKSNKNNNLKWGQFNYNTLNDNSVNLFIVILLTSFFFFSCDFLRTGKNWKGQCEFSRVTLKLKDLH